MPKQTPRAATIKNNTYMNINTLLQSGANVSITVTPTDLKEFALSLIQEAVEIGKKQRKPERYLTQKEAAEKLNVSENTLWRWRKIGYLIPSKVGKAAHYKLSDIENLLEGGYERK